MNIINKICLISLCFMNFAFTMEQNSENVSFFSKVSSYFRKLLEYEVKNNGVDFTKILPKEVIQEIIVYFLNEIKYPKSESIKLFNDSRKLKSENLKNIRVTNKSLYLIVNSLFEQKNIIEQFKKYDEIDKPLFDELNKLLWSHVDFKRVLELITKWRRS